VRKSGKRNGKIERGEGRREEESERDYLMAPSTSIYLID
jgi:hypothetical protein